jgi:hypothetical protein
MMNRFLSATDAERAARSLRKLVRNDISDWALTGGLAIELHCLRLGLQTVTRTLQDIDFVTASFDSIPETLANDFLFRHIHPSDPPGKTLVQFADPDEALRIDLFRTHVSVMRRISGVDDFWIVSLEDLVSNLARLTLSLAEGDQVPAKHARDFLRLVDRVDPGKAEVAWQDYRKQKHPATFIEAARVLRDLIPAHRDLLISLVYSQDTSEICPRCASTAGLQLADPNAVLAVLGYC